MSPVCRALVLLCLTGCAPDTSVVFHDEHDPSSLSEWGVLALREGRLQVSTEAQVYELNTPLFSDYAHKLRTVWMPPDRSAAYTESGVFDLPVGTVLTKTFYYPRAAAGEVRLEPFVAGSERVTALSLEAVQLIETRVLVRRTGGWQALSYVWNEAQTEARRVRTGEVFDLAYRDGAVVRRFNYAVPDENQCASCHATDAKSRALQPLGLAARHLQHPSDSAPSSLAELVTRGFIRNAPATPAIFSARLDSDEPIEARARAYLDINCGHCHHPSGPADTSGLALDATALWGPALGVCKSPIAAGRGTGNRRFGIVPGNADASILLHRVESRETDVMMPELGRSLSHAEGVAVLRAWIEGMTPKGCA